MHCSGSLYHVRPRSEESNYINIAALWSDYNMMLCNGPGPKAQLLLERKKFKWGKTQIWFNAVLLRLRIELFFARSSRFMTRRQIVPWQLAPKTTRPLWMQSDPSSPRPNIITPVEATFSMPNCLYYSVSKILSRVRGGGSVGRAVASDTRDPRFDSRHHQKCTY